MHDGDPLWYKIPNDSNDFNRLIQKLKPFLRKKEVRLLIGNDGNLGRLTGRIKEKGSKAVGIKNKSLDNFIQQSDFKHIQTRVTGSSDLCEENL
jgi:hypothetical protein